jgi:hypothetical protein
MTDPQDVAAPNSNLLARFLKNRWNAFSLAVGVLGLILGFYSYVHGNKKRDLVYYVNPAQAVVVKTGESSKLHVFYGNHELTSDVTAAQIAVWNQGNESIRPDNVLRQVMIRTNPSVPILEASIRKKSRDVVNVTLDQSHLNDGVVGVQWNILEQNDEAIIQIVYAGPPTNQIQAAGVIEGQGDILQLRDPDKIWTSDAKPTPTNPKAVGIFAIAVALAMASFFIYSNKKVPISTLPSKLFFVIMYGLLISLFALGIAFFFLPSGPPIGFE